MRWWILRSRSFTYRLTLAPPQWQCVWVWVGASESIRFDLDRLKKALINYPPWLALLSLGQSMVVCKQRITSLCFDLVSLACCLIGGHVHACFGRLQELPLLEATFTFPLLSSCCIFFFVLIFLIIIQDLESSFAGSAVVIN